jgi:hypothetical protein
MALANYTELKTAVTRAIKRDGMATWVDDWIVMFEKDMNSYLRRREMSQRATTSTAVGQATYALPADFGDAISMHLNLTTGVRELQASDWTRIATGYDDQGEPLEWAITQNEFILGPTPDGIYTLELYYYKAVPDLATNTTNWLLTAYPRVYLLGTLAQAAVMVDDPASQQWIAGYRDALNTLKMDQVRERGFGGGPLLRTDHLPFGSGDNFSIVTGE